MTAEGPQYQLSLDKAHLQLDWIVSMLRESYWAGNRTENVVRASIERSRCYGMYVDSLSRQVGFARVVSDEATFSWLCDVVVDPAHRARGVGKLLVSAVVSDPALKGTMIHLGTRDAHGLYEKYGFVRSESMRRAPVSGNSAPGFQS